MFRSAIIATASLGLLLTSACGDEEQPIKKMEPSARHKAATPNPPSKQPATPPAPAPKPPSNEPETRELTKLGYSIEVPGKWKSKEINPNLVTFKIPGGEQQAGALIPYRLHIAVEKKAPRNFAVAAKSCPADVIEKKKEASGHYYYVCKQTAVRRTLLNFQYYIPGKGKKQPTINCSGSGAKIDALLAACKTLQKI